VNGSAVTRSPLGIYLGIDFEVTDVIVKPSELWHRLHPQRPQDTAALLQQSSLHNNLIEEFRMTLLAVEPPGKDQR
jgi:hypothetical protein